MALRFTLDGKPEVYTDKGKKVMIGFHRNSLYQLTVKEYSRRERLEGFSLDPDILHSRIEAIDSTLERNQRRLGLWYAEWSDVILKRNYVDTRDELQDASPSTVFKVLRSKLERELISSSYIPYDLTPEGW